MKKGLFFIFLSLLLIFVNFSIFGQDLNKIIVDPKTKANMLIGYCSREGLKSEPFNEWFKEEYDNYIVDTLSLDSISKEKFKNLSILIIMGTWCGDSRREVPRFYKIIDELNFNEQNITLINVDRKMKVCDIDIDKFDISRVPTFIFFNKGEEIGRIIETPINTLEKDLIGIVPVK
ncbi:MAG: thioredoxin family protein [Bacteroidetes bacterium]|nr:thioredoxin family protein [Bacteroidota bacterium]